MTLGELQQRMDALGIRSITMSFGKSVLPGEGYFCNALTEENGSVQVRAASIEEAIEGVVSKVEAVKPRRRVVEDLA